MIFIKPLITIFIFTVLAVSGCITTEPAGLAKTHPIIKGFLEEYPNAQITITHFDEAEFNSIIDDIADCQKDNIEPMETYRVTVRDADSELYAVAWIDWEEMIVKDGEGSQEEIDRGEHFPLIAELLADGSMVCKNVRTHDGKELKFYMLTEIGCQKVEDMEVD